MWFLKFWLKKKVNFLIFVLFFYKELRTRCFLFDFVNYFILVEKIIFFMINYIEVFLCNLAIQILIKSSKSECAALLTFFLRLNSALLNCWITDLQSESTSKIERQMVHFSSWWCGAGRAYACRYVLRSMTARDAPRAARHAPRRASAARTMAAANELLLCI